MRALMQQVKQAGQSWYHFLGATFLALAPELIALGDDGDWWSLLTPLGVGRILAALGAVWYAGAKIDLAKPAG